MKRMHLILTLVVVLVCALCVSAFAATVVCNGNRCGGNGPRNFFYMIDGCGPLITEFRVAVSDTNAANYSRIWMPPTWRFSVVSSEGWGPMGPFTPHGLVHQGQIWGSAGYVVFAKTMDIGMTGASFGFNYAGAALDAHWEVDDDTPATTSANWLIPVGTGLGPVHAP